MRRPLHAVASTVLALALVALAVPAHASAAPAVRLRVEVGGFCVEGTGRPRARHTFTVRAADGVFRARATERSSDRGDFAACFFNGQLIFLNAGDIVMVRTDRDRERIVIPDLLPRVDRSTDVVKGGGPPGTDARITISRDPGDPAQTWTVPARGDGRWRLDTTGERDILGGDRVEVRMRQGGHRFKAVGHAPHLAVSLATNVVAGSARPGQRVWVSLEREGAQLARSGSVSLLGSLTAALETPRADPVYPRPGDVVRSNVAGGVVLIVPPARLRADAATATIRFRCLPDSRYRVTVRDGAGSWLGETSGWTDEDGRTRIGMGGLHRSHTLSAECRYPSGDRILLESGVR